MLNKLHVKEFTKSRPRRSNDNALVESKNGNVVRRWLLRRIVEAHTEMTEFLLSVAKRGAYPRYRRRRDRSDAEVVMSDLATTISDLGTASARVIKKQSGGGSTSERWPISSTPSKTPTPLVGSSSASGR